MLCMYIMLKILLSFLYIIIIEIYMLWIFFMSYDALLSLAKYIFLIVHTSGYRKTNCIHINCDVYDVMYGNISGKLKRGAFPLFPRISNMSRHVLLCLFMYYHVFIRIFFVTNLYIYLYICLYIRSYISKYVYTFICTFIHKYICLYIYIT